MRCAIFSKSLRQQVSYFNKCGFVLIRRSQENQEDIALLNTEILSYLHNRSNTISYQYWRLFNPINENIKRHSIPLPFSDISGLENVLHSSIASIVPFLQSQLKHDAPLVELSSIISLPGASEQEIHSDIAFAGHTPLVLSVMVALSPLTIAKGPTCLSMGSNRQECHAMYAGASSSVYYSSDGSMEDVPAYHEVHISVTPMSAILVLLVVIILSVCLSVCLSVYLSLSVLTTHCYVTPRGQSMQAYRP